MNSAPEIDRTDDDALARARVSPGAIGVRTLVIAGAGKPAEAELRRRIAADVMPDVVSAEDAVGATIADDRYFAAMGGLTGRLLRRLPLLVAQGVEVLLRGGRYDAVLTWGDRPAIVIGAVMRVRRRRPAHVAILMWPSKTKKAALLRPVLKEIDRFIVWPALQRRFVEKQLHVPAEQFVEARAPVDTAFWRPMDGDDDLICSVGQEMRDYGTLVEALRPLDIPCHIAAGTGMFNTRFLEGEWQENVGEQALPETITVGRKSHAELRDLYARSRFVVVPLRPSDMDNGITVILEAFAMGKAVICTETDGQTGVLAHGVNCLRVPAGDPAALRDAITTLWNDPEQCARLAQAGRRTATERHNLGEWRATLVQAVAGAIAAHDPSTAGPGEPAGIAAPVAPSRVGTLVLTSSQGKPPQHELRRRIAADVLPDTVSADDAIGATILDDRSFAANRSLYGRFLSKLPLLAAQAVEVTVHGGRYDAVMTWGERHSVVVAAILRLRPRRPAHVAILIWPSKSAKVALPLRLTARWIDRFIVPSPLQRRFVERHLHVPAERIVDSQYPIDTRFWRPIDGPGDLICAAGQEMRDYKTLLTALRTLDIPCHIAAGQGLFNARFLSEDWDSNVGEQAIPANVTLGRKPHAELRELYARSRFVVVPILPSDNDSGITVISEAFAMGKAVICTESPGQTGVLEPGVNCLRVPPFDPEALREAITELWNDREKCARFGAAGRRVVEERLGLDQWQAALVRSVDEAIAARR